MRFVIYDEETLEPITVVNLPGLSDRALNERSHWRIAVPRSLIQPLGEGADYGRKIEYIDLDFDLVRRVSLHHGEQTIWMCLTRATELAMLLTPDWLPGQLSAVQHLQDENQRLTELMRTALSVE